MFGPVATTNSKSFPITGSAVITNRETAAVRIPPAAISELSPELDSLHLLRQSMESVIADDLRRGLFFEQPVNGMHEDALDLGSHP